ncbi:hypothetical protein [Vibrio gangliei]|uniref:hypothetical protein n=1 Tax=Vibrio gangliei TaxID=2077090 RepID=UPI000D013774|nr:hypothetical protein [Vibrio gangliei]
MPRFVQILQILIAIVVGGYVGVQMILHGIAIFNTANNWFAVMTVVLGVLLEISLFVIYKLIEED